MSEFYSSNADSVKDFLNNYTDQQIEGMEDMSESLNNQLSLKWRAQFDQAHAKAVEEGQLSGELLGGLLGVKGIGKGIGKLRDIYKKGKALKDKAEDLKNKLTGEKKEDSLDDDLEDTDNKIPSNSKGNTEEEGDQDTSERTPDSVDEDTGKGQEGGDQEEYDDLGDEDFDPQGALDKLKSSLGEEGEGAEGAGEGAGEGADSTIDIDSLLSRIAAARARAQKALDDDDDPTPNTENVSGKPPSTEQEGDQDESSDLGRGSNETELIGGDEDSVGARVGRLATDAGEDVETQAEGGLSNYASDVTSQLASRASSIKQLAQSSFKTATKYSDGSVKKGSEDADDEGGGEEEDVEEGLGEDLAEGLGEDASLGITDSVLAAVPVVGEAAIIGTGIYEGIKGLIDIFEPDTPSPPKPKALGGVLSGGNPLNIGSDSGEASKLTSGIPTMDDVQDVSNSLSF